MIDHTTTDNRNFTPSLEKKCGSYKKVQKVTI